MNADALLANFDVFSEAPGGMNCLRELILNLAIEGKLLPQISSEFCDEIIWTFDSLRLDEQRIWGNEYLVDAPKTWSKVPLARLGSWGSGGTPTRGNRSYYGGQIPWLIIGDLNDGIVTTAANSITEMGLQESSATVVPVGAVFVAMYGSIGKSGIAGIECATNQAIAHCVPDLNVISTEYLFLIVQAIKPRLFAQGRGLAQQNISQTVIKHLMISIPPLAEQKRIIAKVDELMAICDQLQQQKNQRNNLRMATRKSAIDAISTADTAEEMEQAWERIKNNFEIFSDTSESISALKELILEIKLSGKASRQNAWPISKFGDLGTCRLGKMLDKAKNVGAPHGYLRNANVQWFRIDLTDISKMKVRAEEVAEYSLQPGDLLICEGGEPGRCAIVGSDIKGLLFQKALHRFRPNSETNAKFVAYWLMLASKNGTLASRFTGMTISHLTGQVLKNLDIAIPDITEQNEIVETIDQLMELCDLLEYKLKVRSAFADKFARSVVSAA